MQIVEQRVTRGDRPIFDLEEFLARPLFAHLATIAEDGPRESPVWFHWEDGALWVIGGTSFPGYLRRDPRCAVGIVDFDRATGLVHHVGIRGTAAVLPFDTGVARKVFRKYFGPREEDWDARFDDVLSGRAGLDLVRITPETVVIRDQSYTTGPARADQAGSDPSRGLGTRAGDTRSGGETA
jgi:hypothetical protein